MPSEGREGPFSQSNVRTMGVYVVYMKRRKGTTVFVLAFLVASFSGKHVLTLRRFMNARVIYAGNKGRGICIQMNTFLHKSSGFSSRKITS